MEVTRASRVRFAETMASFVGPLLSWTSWRKTRSGVLR